MVKNRIISIKRSSEFVELKKSAHRATFGYLVINFKRGQGQSHRLGLTIPKKVGNAVIRNKLKRWSKEILRQNRDLIESPHDISLILRAGKEKEFFKKLTYVDYKEKLLKAIQFIQKASVRS